MWIFSENVFIWIILTGIPFVLVVLYFYLDEQKEKQKREQKRVKTLEKRITELEKQKENKSTYLFH